MSRTMRSRQGFTLLEIMVVMVIIAVLAAVITPNLFAAKSRGKDLEHEAAALAARIVVAQDDAMLYGHEYGIVFADDGYRFVRWDPKAGRFAEVADGTTWIARKFDDDVKVSAAAESAEPILVVPEPKATDGAAPAPAAEPEPKPSVFVLSSGEVTPFTAVFTADGDAVPLELRIDPLGNRLYPPGAAPPADDDGAAAGEGTHAP